jgi:hypothetical protein
VWFAAPLGGRCACGLAKPVPRPLLGWAGRFCASGLFCFLGRVLVALTEDHVLAATRHWLESAVIGLNLCPFAKAVYVKNQVRLVVSRARHADDLLEELDRELDLLVAAPADEIDTTLLIHATLFDDFLDFNDFLEVADGVVEEHALEGVIQLASFHPKFQFDGTEPDDISNYTNRAPFAMLHLLREDSVERAVAAFPEADAIFDENIKTLEKLGQAGWAKLGL